MNTANLSDNAQKIKAVILKNYRETGNKTMPPVIQLAQSIPLSVPDIQNGIRELMDSGFLRKYPNYYYLPTASRNGKTETVLPNKLVKNDDVLGKVKNLWQQIKSFRVDAGILVRVVLFLISIISMYISISFSYLWTSQFLEPFKAALLSCAVVAYITFAPEGAMILFKGAGFAAKAFGFIVSVTAVMALIFSMSMILIGQYNLHTDLINKQSQETKTDRKQSALLELARADEKTAAAAVAGLEKDLAQAQNSLTLLSPDDSGYAAASWRVTDVQNRLYYARDRLTRARIKIEELLKTGDVDARDDAATRKSFADWISEQTGTGAGTIEFVLYLIPALFCDLLAPLGMLVALGLWRKKERK